MDEIISISGVTYSPSLGSNQTITLPSTSDTFQVRGLQSPNTGSYDKRAALYPDAGLTNPIAESNTPVSVQGYDWAFDLDVPSTHYDRRLLLIVTIQEDSGEGPARGIYSIAIRFVKQSSFAAGGGGQAEIS